MAATRPAASPVPPDADFLRWAALASERTRSPAAAAAGDLVRDWIGPDGRPIHAVVKLPHAAARASAVVLSAVPAGADAGPYFAAALERLRQLHAGRLDIPFGTYSFTSPVLSAEGMAHLVLRDLTDVTIDGHGATLVFGCNEIGLLITASRRVRLAHVRLRTSLHTASTGVIRRQDGHNRLVLDPAFPVTGNDQVRYVVEYDRAAQRFSRGGTRVILPPGADGGARFLGNRTYAADAFERLPLDEAVAVLHHWYGGASIRIGGGPGPEQPEDIVVDDVTIVSGPGMGIFAYGLKRGLAIVNSHIARDPASPVSVEYDGIHVLAVGGDCILTGNDISGQGDDGINLNDPLTGIAAVAANTLTMAPYSRFIAPGDVLAFFDAEDRFAGITTVAATKPAGALDYSITVAKVPEGIGPLWQVRDLALIDSRVAVVDNRIGDCNCHGLLVQGPNTLVENNVFHDTAYNAIRLLTSLGMFKEGAGAINVVVRDNSIRDSGPDSSVTMPWSAIAAYALIAPNRLSPTPANKDLLIAENHVDGADDGCITIASSVDVRVERNTCIDVNRLSRQRGSITVLHAAHVTLSGNRRGGPSSGAIDIDGSASAIDRQTGY